MDGLGNNFESEVQDILKRNPVTAIETPPPPSKKRKPYKKKK